MLPLLSPLALSAGCATGSRARTVETESGKIAVISAAKTPSEATIAALDQANRHCAETQKKPIFGDELLKPKEKEQAQVDLRKIPVIGQIFKDEGQTQVALQFRCG